MLAGPANRESFKQGPLGLMAELGQSEFDLITRGFDEQRPGGPTPRRTVAEYTDFARHVLVDDLDGVRVLTIRRPQALGALDDRVTAELLAAIEQAEGDPSVEGFVIIGYGDKAFSAGADIGRFPECLGDTELSAQYARDCSGLLRHLDGMTKPVVAALNGMALGGGVELALRCDSAGVEPTCYPRCDRQPSVTRGAGTVAGKPPAPLKFPPG